MNEKVAHPGSKAKLLRASGYWQALMDGSEEELAVIERDFHVSYASSALIRRCGLRASKTLGHGCYLLPDRDADPCATTEWDGLAKRVWDTGEPVAIVRSYGGAESLDAAAYIEIKASPIRDKEGNITAAVLAIRDITELKRLEQKLTDATRNLLALHTIGEAVSQSLELDDILDSALDKVLELVKGDTGGILLLDDETKTLSYRVYRGLSEEFIRAVSGLKLGEGIAGLAAQRGEAICVDDISKDPRLTRWTVVKEGLRAFASIPLVSKTRVLGVMNVASYTLNRFGPEDIQLLGNIANQIAMAIENSRLYEELRNKEEMRGELLKLVISTQEEERRRIARELHDQTSQALTGLAIGLQSTIDLLPSEAEDIRAKLLEVKSTCLGTLDEIHKVIYELRPTLLDDLGLIPALKWHAENYLEPAGIRARVKTVGKERRLPLDVEAGLFRIVQEATTNIVRHASARNANIRLEFGDGAITVHVEDDGRGFDPNEVARAKDGQRGLGLLSMKERVELLGGELKITSSPGKGTHVDIKIAIN